MENDLKLCIATGANRRSTSWPTQEVYWSAFVAKLQVPTVTTETFAAYKALSKAKQDDLKDVGGFVAGRLLDNRRKNDKVVDRSMICLDADSIGAGGTQNVLSAVDALGCAYVVYSTRKHESAAPRLRIIIPLDKPCAPEAYEPIARKLASYIGISIFDPTTFDVARLMYWPSISADMMDQYVFVYGDKPFLSGDGILGQFNNWRDVREWPEVPGAEKIRATTAKRQGDPLEKKGVVGAFCRIYDIETAIAKFIPDAYVPADTPGRYTYTEGSTVGGAVLYDDGKYLFSHHATDPISNKLCNAFDLVRLHKFAQLDEESKETTPVASLPSYKAMRTFAVEDPEVKTLLSSERYQQAVEEFGLVENQVATQMSEVAATQNVVVQDAAVDDPMAWLGLLKMNDAGRYQSTIENTLIVLEHDPFLAGRIYHDLFANRAMVCASLPWEQPQARYQERAWGDADDAGLRLYMEKFYGITGQQKIYDALAVYATKHGRHKIKEYLDSLTWDGVPRLDRLLIDYFGADPTQYSMEVSRKAFTAAVARVYKPGTKFDNMLILAGAQGVGKTTFFRKIGLAWFSDSLRTFEGKEASELLQGYWILEIGELEAFNKSEMSTIKQFLSKNDDIYRAPYGRRTEAFPRTCVFFGTTNESDFLRDRTGNRRFWPVDVHKERATKSVFEDLDSEVDQIWAEAKLRYSIGEKLYLDGVALEEAEKAQEAHKESNPKEGLIIDFIAKPVPRDWNNWDLNARRVYWASGGREVPEQDKGPRDRICATEIWCECLGNDIKYMQRKDTFEINGILGGLGCTEKIKDTRRFGPAYGSQRGYWVTTT